MTVTQLPQPERRTFDNCEGIQQAEVIERTGITYRQLDYWTSSLRVKAHFHLAGRIDPHGGTGTIRCWNLDQVKIMERVAALLRRGLELNHAFILATNRQATAALLAELTYIQADLIEEETEP